MRFFNRLVLVALLSLFAVVPIATADHFAADCPLSLVAQDTGAGEFLMSPHGVFTDGTSVYVLRGQTLTTYTINDVGSMDIARTDVLDTLSARENAGAVAFQNGYLFLSTEAGLEIFDLRDTHAGGTAPVLVSRTPGLHYRAFAVSGNILAALYPAVDMPCIPQGVPNCSNSIDIYDITDLNAPAFQSSIQSAGRFVAFNDIAWANGFLWATGAGGTFAFDLTNPLLPATVYSSNMTGTFLDTNGTTMMAIGQERQIAVFMVGPSANLRFFHTYTLPSIMDRGNELMFHRQAWIDENRLIAMVDEKDPQTGNPARTIAFDAFDFSVPYWEGYDDRLYENVSMTYPDEVKYNPIMVGPYVYVVGEISGMQTWGACGVMAGKIEFTNDHLLPCGGAEIHGYVTGTTRITNVELFLGDQTLGNATFGKVRTDVSSTEPVVEWSVPVNFDNTPAGDYTLRAVGTDIDGNVRQFATQNVTFGGPGNNCTSHRRLLGHR